MCARARARVCVVDLLRLKQPLLQEADLVHLGGHRNQPHTLSRALSLMALTVAGRPDSLLGRGMQTECPAVQSGSPTAPRLELDTLELDTRRHTPSRPVSP